MRRLRRRFGKHPGWRKHSFLNRVQSRTRWREPGEWIPNDFSGHARHVRDGAEHRAWWESTSCFMRPISVAVEQRGLGTGLLILAMEWWRSSAGPQSQHSQTAGIPLKNASRMPIKLNMVAGGPSGESGFWCSSIPCKTGPAQPAVRDLLGGSGGRRYRRGGDV